MGDRQRRGWSVLAAVAAVVVLAGCTAAAATTLPAAQEQFTPVVMRVMSPPRWFTGSDARVHLTYELELTNAIAAPVTVTKVAVRDGGQVLLTLSGDALKASMSLLTSGTQPAVELAPSTVGVVWVDVTLDGPGRVPARIDHELTVSVPPGLPIPTVVTDSGAAADVARQAPTALGAPLEGPGWIAVGSCCDGPHRRAVQPIDNALWLGERFAIDFNRISKDRLLVVGDPGRNEDWLTYDQPVLAVADADVVGVVDGLPDQVPDAPKPVTIEDADGNHVILKLADGVYAFYAHLEPGTVGVHVGDRVRKGQAIARTGNSGSSTGPHLHFQLMDRPSALVSDGLPYVFDRFTLTGRTPPFEDLVKTDPANDPVPVDTATAGPRQDQLPLGRDDVEFPAG